MTRRTAVLIGVFAAALAALEVVVLSGLLAADRHDERQRYTDAIARQRRTAGRAVRPAATDGVASATRTEFCVRGVDTIALSIKSGLGVGVVDKGELDVAELSRLSRLAIRAEKYVERANAGPALPQRLGRTRDPSGDWKSLEPRKQRCEDGEGFAAFRLDVPEPDKPAAAPESKTPKRTKPKKPRRKQPRG